MADFVLHEVYDIPIQATFSGERIVESRYAQIDVPASQPPATPSELMAPTERYVALTSQQGAHQLGLVSLPLEMDGMPLIATFEYQYEDATATYIIWRADDGREVQVIATTGHDAGGRSGLEDQNGYYALQLQESDGLVQIIATDRPGLARAVAELRPAEVKWIEP